jgi:hypothetical protein
MTKVTRRGQQACLMIRAGLRFAYCFFHLTPLYSN